MSERPIASLEEFWDEFVGTVPPKSGEAIKEVVNAVQGGPVERARTAVVESVQDSGAVPIVAAGVVSASTLISPVVAAAQNLSHSVGTRVTHRAEHNSETHGNRSDEVSFRLEPGGTVDEYGERYARQMGVNVPTADGEIEAASDIAPDQVNDLPVGTEIDVPLDRDITIVPAGEDLSQEAAGHGMTLERLLELNPDYKSHENFVEAGARLRVEPPKPAAEAPVVKARPRHKNHAAKSRTPKLKVPVVPQVTERTAAPAAPSKPVAAAPKKAAAPVRHKSPAAVVAPESHPAPLAKTKPKQTVHPKPNLKPGPGIGSALQQDLGQVFAGTAASLGEGSRKLEQNTLFGVTSTTQGITKAIPHWYNQPHHNKQHKAVLASHIGECASTGHMFGASKEQIAINYFVICDGESVAQAAGDVGNLMQESSIQPEEIQNGGFSKDPADAGKGGWGLAQWTPGAKALSESKKYGIKGPIYTMQTQLTLISAEMKGKSPTGEWNMAQGLKQLKDPAQAAEYFEQDFEEGPIAAEGGGQLSNRQEYAREAARQYGAAALEALHSQGHQPHKAESHRRPHEGKHSRHTATARHIGKNAAIYYAALKYNAASYQETSIAGHEGVSQWHTDFPEIGPNAVIDCSGLVNLAVSDATGGRVELNENTTTERSDKADWKEIPYSKAGRGDLIQPIVRDHEGIEHTGEHVEIINYVQGNEIYTFGAHTNYQRPQPDQVGPAEFTENRQDTYLRYVGPGAPLGNGVSPKHSSHTKLEPHHKHGGHHKKTASSDELAAGAHALERAWKDSLAHSTPHTVAGRRKQHAARAGHAHAKDTSRHAK